MKCTTTRTVNTHVKREVYSVFNKNLFPACPSEFACPSQFPTCLCLNNNSRGTGKGLTKYLMSDHSPSVECFAV